MFLFRSKDARPISPPRSRDKDAPLLHDLILEGAVSRLSRLAEFFVPFTRSAHAQRFVHHAVRGKRSRASRHPAGPLPWAPFVEKHTRHTQSCRLCALPRLRPSAADVRELRRLADKHGPANITQMICATDSMGRNALHVACEDGDDDVLRNLIKVRTHVHLVHPCAPPPPWHIRRAR